MTDEVAGQKTANENTDESFRDSLGIVEKSGARKWVYPKQPKGRYTTARTILSSLLLLVLFGVPFITWNGHPYMLFDIATRNFILFGYPFGPHDFFLLGLVMITTIIFIFLFTAVYGRLFCGWICPQTVFMESVFRKIDYWVEGDYRAQRRLNDSSWNGEKIFKKGTKYLIYFIVSFLVANMLLAWIIGVDDLWKIVKDPISEHTGGFSAMILFTTLFYWIFIWFREQACILVCPYGRLQGVLLDRNSLVIAYDYLRGEPRGKIKRDEERTKGDCIDCKECVVVCPTGIDIRNGTQLECVNCTACIDACDAVMDKIKKPRGLIRFDSINGITTKVRKIFTSRVIGYTIVQMFLLSLLGYFLVTRSDFDITILRTPGMFYQEQPHDMVSNLYDIKVLNKTFEQKNLELKILNGEGEIKILGDPITVSPQGEMQAKAFVLIKKNELKRMNTPVVIGVYSAGIEINKITTSFLGPVENKKKDNEKSPEKRKGKEMKKKSWWGVGIVISFIVFAVCILAAVYVAMNSRVDLVSDNYYENELKYQDHIDLVHNTNALEGKVEMTFTRSVMNIAFPNITLPERYSGTILFFRPSDQTKDFATVVKIDSMFTQHISTEKIEKGMWRVKISWNAGGKQYYSEQPVMIQ